MSNFLTSSQFSFIGSLCNFSLSKHSSSEKLDEHDVVNEQEKKKKDPRSLILPKSNEQQINFTKNLEIMKLDDITDF